MEIVTLVTTRRAEQTPWNRALIEDPIMMIMMHYTASAYTFEV
jgi:hypothetical protein